MMRNFLPNLSDHGPIKSANMMGGIPFTNKVTNWIVATVCKKEINFLKITKSIYVSNLGTTYFLNIFLNIVKITIIKIITDIIMIGRTISKYNTPNLKKFLKKWWNKFGYVADSNQFFSRLSGFYDCKYVYFDEVFFASF